MRYGLLVDLGQRILRAEPIDLTMGFVNVIWQGDANAMALASLGVASVPARIVNLAGPGPLLVRDLATALGAQLGQPVRFSGSESSDALLSNGAHGWSLLGPPRVDVDQLVVWTADWLRRGRATLDKPTHFESRDGRF